LGGERNSSYTDSCLSNVKVECVDDLLLSDWIDNLDTRCPMMVAPWMAEFFRRENGSIAIDQVRLILLLFLRCRRNDIVF